MDPRATHVFVVVAVAFARLAAVSIELLIMMMERTVHLHVQVFVVVDQVVDPGRGSVKGVVKAISFPGCVSSGSVV